MALPLHGLYCREIAPREDYVAGEATCENLTLTDIGLTLMGTVDRVRATPNGLGIADIKTGKTAVVADGTVKTQGHATQLAVYEILAAHAIGRAIDALDSVVISLLIFLAFCYPSPKGGGYASGTSSSRYFG